MKIDVVQNTKSRIFGATEVWLVIILTVVFVLAVVMFGGE